MSVQGKGPVLSSSSLHWRFGQMVAGDRCRKGTCGTVQQRYWRVKGQHWALKATEKWMSPFPSGLDVKPNWDG